MIDIIQTICAYVAMKQPAKLIRLSLWENLILSAYLVIRGYANFPKTTWERTICILRLRIKHRKFSAPKVLRFLHFSDHFQEEGAGSAFISEQYNCAHSGLSISHVRRPGLSIFTLGLAHFALNKSLDLSGHISASIDTRTKYDPSICIYVSQAIHFFHQIKI